MGLQFLLCLLKVLLSHPGIEMASRNTAGCHDGKKQGQRENCNMLCPRAPEGHGCEGERRFEISEIRSWLVEILSIIKHVNVSQRLGSH